MSDLLSLGSSAISIYKQALTTVSNNIANVNSEGYSRQTVTVSQNQPVQTGTTFLGTGARLAAIERQFDVFVEQQLRGSTSDLAAQKPLVEYAGRILDRFASKDSALSGSLDRFFASLADLSADASSLALREVALSDAALLADRFQSLDRFLDNQADGSEADLQVSVAEINALTKELGGINQKLTRRDALAKQPPALLDERDQLLRELSEKVRLDVSEAPNGEVTLRLGSSAGAGAILAGPEVRLLGLQLDPLAEDRAAFYLEPATPAQGRMILSGVSGGTIGGLVTFREQVLEPTRATLDTLARGLVRELNRLHGAGIGLDGVTGRDLFTLKPDYQLAGLDALRGFRLETTLESPGAAVIDNFELRLDPTTARWSAVIPASLDAPGRTVVADDDGLLRLDGVALRIEGSSTGAVSLKVRGQEGGAGDVVLSLARAEHLAGADPLRVRAAELNSDSARAFVRFSPDTLRPAGPLPVAQRFVNNPDPSAGLGLAGGPSAFASVPAGSEGTELRLSGATAEGTQFRVFTREGILLSGPPLQEAEQAAMITEANGFTTRATYRALPEDASFRELVLREGVFASEALAGGFRLEADYAVRLRSDGDLPAETQAALAAGALTLNGSALTGAIPADSLGVTSAQSLAAWFNGQAAAQTAGVVAEASNRLVFTDFDFSASDPLLINGIEVAAVGSAQNLAALVDGINAHSASTKVVAQQGLAGELILRNVAGEEGRAIRIGAQGSVPADENILKTVESFGGQLAFRASDPFSLSPGEGFAPALLADMGFDGRLRVEGVQRDDLLLFVSGSEGVTVSASFGERDFNPLANLREASLEVRFEGGGERYVIADLATGTELASGRYVPGSAIRYGGAVLTFDGQPAGGDRFLVEDNGEGVDDNRNVLRLAALAEGAIGALGEKSAGAYYASLASRVGTISRQAVIGEEALEVVKAQAEEARDRVSGVSLDEEAADLIRYQQAYQAAAKIIQTSQDLFDAVLAI